MKLVPRGERLELLLKGPSITPGYFGDPAATAAAFDKEGFYRMGDALRPADPDDVRKGFTSTGGLRRISNSRREHAFWSGQCERR